MNSWKEKIEFYLSEIKENNGLLLKKVWRFKKSPESENNSNSEEICIWCVMHTFRRNGGWDNWKWNHQLNFDTYFILFFWDPNKYLNKKNKNIRFSSPDDLRFSLNRNLQLRRSSKNFFFKNFKHVGVCGSD